MYRRSKSVGPRLEALLDERDHLQIQISLASEAAQPNAHQLDVMRKRLAELEREITRGGSTPPTE